MFILLISNHTVFLVQFGINLHLWVFSFLKNSLVQINSKLNSKPYDYLYKYWKIYKHALWRVNLTWLCETLFTSSAAPLSNLATFVLYQETNLLFVPATCFIVQDCEMNFSNNITRCNSACWRDTVTFLVADVLLIRESKSYSFVSLSLTSVFQRVFPVASLVRISDQLPQEHKLCNTLRIEKSDTDYKQ